MVTATTNTEALDMILKASQGYVTTFTDQWGEFGRRGRGLVYTDSGLARMAQIVGWITGIHQHDRDAAEQLAGWFVDRLDFLGNYGRMSGEEGDIDRVPNSLVELADDGTFGGFSLLWHSRIPKDRLSEVPQDKRRFRRGHTDVHWYTFSMNGGLLFHGLDHSSGGAPTFAVRLGSDPNPWSIHT